MAGAGAGRVAPRRWLGALFVLLAAQFVPQVVRAQTFPPYTQCGESGAGMTTSGWGSLVQFQYQSEAIAFAKSYPARGMYDAGPYMWLYDLQPTPESNTSTRIISIRYKNTGGKRRNDSDCAVVSSTVQSDQVRSVAQYSLAGCPGDGELQPDGTCFDSAVCLARNSDLGSQGGLPRPSYTTARCVAGCKFAMASVLSETISFDGKKVYRGVMEYTGDSCTADEATPDGGTEDEQKEPPPQLCLAHATTGQQTCIKQDGQNCYKLSSMTKQVCFGPGETGEKSEGPDLVVRNAGNLPVTPATPPPSGDSLVQEGVPAVTTHITNNTTTTTTTTIYQTVNGTDATPVNSGEALDGVDGGTEGGVEAGILQGIKDKLGEILDGFTGDGEDHAADGAQAGDTDVWSDGETISASSLDTSGEVSSCPALWTSGGEGMASFFLIETPVQWCDFIANIRKILILFAVLTGILLVWKG